MTLVERIEYLEKMEQDAWKDLCAVKADFGDLAPETEISRAYWIGIASALRVFQIK